MTTREEVANHLAAEAAKRHRCQQCGRCERMLDFINRYGRGVFYRTKRTFGIAFCGMQGCNIARVWTVGRLF